MLQKSTLFPALYGALVGALVVALFNFIFTSREKMVAPCEAPAPQPSANVHTPSPHTPQQSSEPIVTPTPTTAAALAASTLPAPVQQQAGGESFDADAFAASTLPAPVQQPQPVADPTMTVKKVYTSGNTIKIQFSTESEILLVPGKNLFISPAIRDLRATFSWWDNRIHLNGEIRGETTYTLTIKAGTLSAQREELKEDVTLQVTTPPLKPSLQFLVDKGQMALTEKTALPCKYTACKELQINVWKAFPNNLIHYGQTTWRDHLLEKCATHTFKLPYDKQNVRHALLPIYELVNGTPGVYRFTVSAKVDNDTLTDECYVILSNIGATYAYDKRLTPIVAVQSLVDGTPMGGAYVALYDDKNQLIAAGISDEQGIAVTEVAPEAATRKGPFTPSRMIVSMEDDITLIECNYTTKHSAYEAEMEEIIPFPTALWPDRDAIHPGESVQLYGLVRDATMTAVNELPLKLKLYTPDNRLIQTETVTSNRDGYFTAAFTPPKGAHHGYYTVLAKLEKEVLAIADLYVSDFTPNHVKLSLDFPNDDISQLNLTTTTYFGSPVTEGRGTYRIEVTDAPLSKEWDEWTIGVGAGSRQLIANSFSKESQSETMTLKGVDEAQLRATHAPIRLTATASFSEPNNRAVTATTFIDKTPHKAYLAMRYDNDSQSVQFKQYVPEGESPVAGTIKDFTLEEHHCSYNLVQDNNGWHYQWKEYTSQINLKDESVSFDASDITLTAETVSKALDALPPGNYTLSAQLNDTVRTSITFWHNLAWAGKRLSNASNLTFTTDKKAYAPGETAQLTFIAPVDGRVVVTCGDTELQNAFATDVTAGQVTLPVPISETTKHGAWLAGVTLIAKNINTEARYFGVAKLIINHSTQKLNLSLAAPQVARPQETITLTLNIATSAGEPCRGTVALFAVDEAVLDVTAFETPDPHKMLFSRTDSPFTFGDIYGSILPQLRLLPDGRIGGDKLLRARRAIDDSVNVTKEATVIALPLQEIGPTGQLTIPVTLPDFKGTLRFMAVAANETNIGSIDATTIVRTPVTLTTAGVRYGCADDQAEITLRLINHDLPTGPYTLTVGNETFSGELAMGETRHHTLRLPAETVTATFQMGDFTTSVTQTVAIQTEIPLHAEVQVKQLREGETLPADAEPLPSMKEVANIALEWLTSYPYNCTEQLSSRLLPYTFSTDEKIRDFVKQTFNRIAARQTSTGGFALWDDCRSTHTQASLFASQVLIEGVQSGILTKELLPRVVGFLDLVATSTNPNNRPEAAYAAFLLGEAKSTQRAIHAARNLLITNKTDPAAYLAATTLVLNGVADEGAPIMKDYLQANPYPQPLLEYYTNTTTAQAMTLYFAMRAGVISPEEIATRFNELTKSTWNTTQSCAWVARALAVCETAIPNKLYRQVVPVQLLRENAPIKVTKEIVDRNGTPVTQLTHGDLAYVVITMDLPYWCPNLVLRDRLPGGLEYEDANLATRESATPPTWVNPDTRFIPQSFENTGAEIRFFGSANDGRNVQVYPVRATTKGTFAIPAAIVEDMYDPNYIGGCDPKEPLVIQ